MMTPKLNSALPPLVAALILSAFSGSHAQLAIDKQEPREGEAMLVQYLEIVTFDVDATCSAMEDLHGVSFGGPNAGLGNARTAVLKGGGMIGVRAPMHESEHPVVRPYVLVDDIEAAIEAAEASGAEVAVPPMEIPGHGKCAIYVLGGIQHGLWQR
jgi:predicted enzyme related to lactoylglutathione lyase